MADSKINQENVKKVVKTALQIVGIISEAAGVFNPIFNVAGPIIKLVQHHGDKDDLMKDLKREFEKINEELENISIQNHQILDIKKSAVYKRYAEIEKNLKNQFRSYMEMVEAKPEHLQFKKDNFVKGYKSNNDDENMNNLYEGVVGIRKLFSQPILEVYLECAQGDKQVMKDLCTHLAYLINIGHTTMMTYYGFMQDDLKLREEEWKEKMEKMREVMGEWM